MKIIFPFLLALLALPHAWGADAISIDDFKKVTNASDRAKLIEKAPPGQRDELRKIDAHLQLLQYVGGEAGLKALRETSAAKARGFEKLEEVFQTAFIVWEQRAVYDVAHRAGKTHDQLVNVEKQRQNEEAAIRNRRDIVHSLVFSLAPTPKALALENEAEKLNDKMSQRLNLSYATPHRLITEEEWSNISKQMDDIYVNLQALPKLTPEQAQKEYDAITDDKIRPF